jgi:hypothetical protein
MVYLFGMENGVELWSLYGIQLKKGIYWNMSTKTQGKAKYLK